MSNLPKVATVRSTMAAACASSATLQVTLIARWPAEVSPPVAARSALSFISTRTTAAPASANAFAVASPMPELAPVTRATSSLKS
jgi:hypothetical protein